MREGLSLVRVFYRLLTANPPTLDDFRSYADLGRMPPASVRSDPDFLRRWEGLSVYDTLTAAYELVLSRERNRERWPFIGVLHIPDEAPIIYEGPESHGHWNLYGADPIFLRDRCLAHIVHVESVHKMSPD
jgi:hypothetical protein